MKKMKLIALLLCTMIVSAVAVGCASKEPTTVETEKLILKVGTDDTYPPFEYKNDANETVGFDIDLIKALAQKMDMEVEIVSTSFDGIFNGLNSKNYDVIVAAISLTPERLENYLFTKPYLANGQVVLTKKGSANIRTPEELAGMKVGVQLGTTADTATAKYKEKVDFEVLKYDEILQTFTAMKAGYVDAIAVDYAVAIEYVQKDPETYQFSDVMLTNEPIAICLRKDEPELQAKLDAALTELKDEGKLKELSITWLGADYTSDIDETLDVIE